MPATRPPRSVVRRFWEPQLDALELAAPDAKSVLQEWAQGRGLPLPRYLEVAREGPDHAPRFTAEVQIEGVAPERGQGANKREAEQAAALAVLLARRRLAGAAKMANASGRPTRAPPRAAASWR